MTFSGSGIRVSTLTLTLAILCFSCQSSAIADIGQPHLEQIRSIVDTIQTWNNNRLSIRERPFITLSFAQSLDGKIAAQADDLSLSQNLPISGEESLYMTHALRSIHDAILVGGKTMFIDNPRLTNRLFGNKQPRPIVLDADLKYIQKLGNKRKVQNAIVCCAQEAISKFENFDVNLTLCPCKVDESGRLDLDDVLYQLTLLFGIRSIMVEGGSSILSSFASKGLVDCLCVTIAPKLIGRGIQAFSLHNLPVDFATSANCFLPLGKDCVFLSKWPS